MALFVPEAGAAVPAGGAPLTRRDVLAGAAAGALAAGAPRLAGAEPKSGGVVPMQLYAFPPPNWHPHCTVSQINSSSGIYNQLIEYNPETEDHFDLRGDLATGWELSEDGKVYTFHLDPRAKWQDGKPVTAEDVVYSMDSMVDADAKPPRIGTLPAISPYYEKGTARAVDAHTVEIPLKIPFAPDFLPTLACDFCKIVAKHWGESGVDVQKWENALGSGPFKPGKLVKDVSIELVKNKDYWKPGLPHIDGMVQYVIKDKGTAIAAYKTGRVLETNVAVTNLSSKEAVQLQKEAEGKIRVEYVQNSSIFFFFMNTSKPPFDNPKVRQAVNLALHRQPVLETFGVPGLDSLGAPLGVGTWFGRSADEIAKLPGWRELNGKKHPDDIAKAKALLAEAGHPDGFKVEMMVRQAVGYPDQAVIYKDQLKKIGIDLNIKLEESATGFQRYLQGDWVCSPQATALFVVQPDSILGKLWMVYWSSANWIFNNRVKGIHASGTIWGSFKHETDWLSAEA